MFRDCVVELSGWSCCEPFQVLDHFSYWMQAVEEKGFASEENFSSSFPAAV